MDTLKIIEVLRASGIEPTIVDVGIESADFRLGVKFKEPYDIYWAGRCLHEINGMVVFGADYFYFSMAIVDEKAFAEIVGGNA
jgi:hypothetical protein